MGVTGGNRARHKHRAPGVSRDATGRVHPRLLLEAYNASDGLLVCAPVYAELLAGPGATIAVLDEFLAATGMTIDHAFPFVVWQDASMAYQAYARRRSAAGQQLPRRILADFAIGAYALHHATALMTLNRDDFMRIFPSLPLIVPNV